MKEISIHEIEGFKIGNAQDRKNATGCTVIICENGAYAGVDVRGGSPASRETELLRPVNTVQQIHAVMLSGGSAFGLEAGDGAMQFLAEKGIGFDTGYGKVPIVCGCSLFDLELVSNTVYPDKAMGYEACKNAYSAATGGTADRASGTATGGTAGGAADGAAGAASPVPEEGNVGAGTGATVGKFRGAERMMKSGLGIYAAQIGAVKVGAIVAVNALGDIIDYDNKKILAGLLTEDKNGFADTVAEMYTEIEKDRGLWGGNTTIGCVITNAKFDKTRCNKLASIAHNGYAQAIRPVHSTADGDTIFVMSTGEVEAGVDAVGALVTECMGRAINRAALTAKAEYGLKCASDLI